MSYNRFLAKLASDHRKPDGLFVITPKMGPAFVEDLPVGKFHDVGPVTAAKMNRLGIHTGLDLRAQPLAFLAEHFGKAADYYYGVARGQDDRLVEADRVRKSVGAENTFATDLTRWEEVGPVLEPVFAKVWTAYGRGGHAGRFKNTSLVSVLAVPDLLYQAQYAATETYRALEVYTTIALVYIVVLLPATVVAKYTEKRLLRER